MSKYTVEDFDTELATKINNKYLHEDYEGSTAAEQAITCVNKILYGWFNNDDVFDTEHWNYPCLNDISSYANWLWYYTTAEIKKILEGIKYVSNSDEYVDIVLYPLFKAMYDENLLKELEQPTEESIYTCEGPFSVECDDEDYEEDDDDYYEEYEDDDYNEDEDEDEY